jgi:DNA repair protein RadC
MKMIDKQSKNSFTVRDLPRDERPRERLKRLGAGNLSVQELLAIIMGRGISKESVLVTSQRLLDKFKTIYGISEATIEELQQIRGIGLAKACQIKAAFELASRWKDKSDKNPSASISAPEDIYKELRFKARGKKKEYFWAVLLDTRNKIIKSVEISIGSLDSSIVHPRELFKEAISASASSIIIAHNHPSGNTQPSEEDIKLTKRLKEGGDIVGIEIIDHIILGEDQFLSMKREGLF